MKGGLVQWLRNILKVFLPSLNNITSKRQHSPSLPQQNLCMVFTPFPEELSSLPEHLRPPKRLFLWSLQNAPCPSFQFCKSKSFCCNPLLLKQDSPLWALLWKSFSTRQASSPGVVSTSALLSYCYKHWQLSGHSFLATVSCSCDF